MQESLQYYIRRLTNLTGRSATLRLLRLSAGRFIDVHTLDQLLGQPSFAIIEALLSDRKQIPLALQVDEGDSENNAMSLRLRRLQRNEQFLYQERGAKDLHVGWPFVEGQLNDGQLVRAPLLLFPVQLQLEKNKWKLIVEKNALPSFNTALLLAYFLRNQLPFLPETREQFVLPALPEDPLSFLVSLYKQIEESQLKLSFNSAQFEQRLQPFRNCRKKEMVDRTKKGCLKLFPQAVLGLFSQGRSTLIDDYTQLLAMNPPPRPEDMLPIKREASTSKSSCAPLPMDGSQEAALEKVKEGESLVVQGPPGTGKSQLITNLICDALSEDRRVLLVCQKRAALDVVRSRLKELGLSDYVTQICDVRGDRKEVYAQLSSHIERLSHIQPSWREAPLQKRLALLEKTINSCSKKWEKLRVLLYDSSACGLPVKSLYLSADLRAPSLPEVEFCLRFSASDLPALEHTIRRYTSYRLRFGDQHPWSRRLSFSRHSVATLPQLQAALRRSKEQLLNLTEQSKQYFYSSPTWVEIRVLFEQEEVLRQLHTQLKQQSLSPKRWLQPPLSKEYLLEAQSQLSLAEELSNQLFCEAPPPALRVRKEAVAQLLPLLPRLQRLRERPLRWFVYKYFRKEYKLVTESCAALSLQESSEGLQQLDYALQKRVQLEQLHEQLRAYDWVVELPEALAEKEAWQQWLKVQTRILELRTLYSSTSLHKFGFRYEENTFSEQLEQLLDWISALGSLSEATSTYLSPEQHAQISEDSSYADLLTRSLFNDFEDLCAFDKLKESLTEVEEHLLSALHKQTNSWHADKIWALFLNSWQLAWIAEIEQRHPVLREVCTEVFEDEAAELLQLQIEKESLSAEWLQLHLQQRAAERYFLPTRRRGTPPYSKLLYQLNKRRQIWPLRRLLAQFLEEIFRLTPCWLVSPETVSALFPLQKCLDLILFDEASQCFVENGLAAIYRTEQVVVVGDKAQLQPSDLYMGRWEEEESEELTEDNLLPQSNMSLLDWAATSLPQTSLLGHYRSQSPELIDFSNQHFYQGRIMLIPAYEVMRDYQPAIHYLKVEGHWENNTNPVEVKTVLDLLCRLFEEQPEKQVGVVTFNHPQQELLLQEIDTYRSTHPTKYTKNWEELFVKNIENVQGDERDTIIFSIGYAPSQDTEQVKHLFGTLNQQGGENRLNVAVTRAKEALYVVSSIWPDALKVDTLSSQGPKLLKAYLQYALEVSEGRYQPMALAEAVPPKTVRLRNKLLSLQDNLKVTFPFADLSYHREGRVYGLLYTDDDLYYNMPSAKAFHLHRPRLLAAKGWSHLDIYSRAYWLHPEKIEQQLQDIINNNDSEDST